MLDRFLSAVRTALIMPRQEVTGRRQCHDTKRRAVLPQDVTSDEEDVKVK